MGKKATITVHPSYRIGEISPRLFGAFLEPIGNLVNGMMYNPKHPTADDKGFRSDVIAALKESGLPAVRLPGGNFVSCWDWKDSMSAEIDISGFTGWKFVEHIEMYSEDLDARNSYDEPNVILPGVNKNTSFENGKLNANLKRLSWNVFRFAKESN